jgi:hypothetical protein
LRGGEKHKRAFPEAAMLATALIILVGCFFGFAGVALAESMGWITLEKSWTANLRPRRLLPVIAIVAAANGIMRGVMSLQASQARNDLVATYCHIGSVSAAQESGYEAHVTAREIEGMNHPQHSKHKTRSRRQTALMIPTVRVANNAR